jgi:endonuclease/exonuclease/phosphatase family metal-dependent hydrolase
LENFKKPGLVKEGDAQRIAQASIVRRNYLPAINAGDYVIVAGDLNDKKGEPAIKRIRGFDDIYLDLIQTGQIGYFKKAEWDQSWTYKFEGVRQQIDHILISRNIKEDCKKGGVDTSVMSQVNPLVSDHRPLIVELGFR